MKIIDFDFEFRQYLEKWIEDNADSYGDYDEMETGMVNVYSNWLSKPADFLGVYVQLIIIKARMTRLN